MGYVYNSSYQLLIASSQIPNAGLGVFTREDISAGSMIDEYTGTVYSSKCTSSYVFEVRPDYYIDAQDLPRCYMAMLNDCSYIPRRATRRKKHPDAYYDAKGQKLVINCEFVVNEATGRVFIHSLTDISAGAELFVSYGNDYWKYY
jgi:SET domain-containing protein